MIFNPARPAPGGVNGYASDRRGRALLSKRLKNVTITLK